MKYLLINFIVMLIFFSCVNENQQHNLILQKKMIYKNKDSLISYNSLIFSLKKLCSMKVLYEMDSITSESKKVKIDRYNYHKLLDSIYANKPLYIKSIDYSLSQGKPDTLKRFMFLYVPYESSLSPPCYLINEKDIMKIIKNNLQNKINYNLDCLK